MVEQLLRTLIASKNEAADDVLIDALRVGNAQEQIVVLGAILARKSIRSLRGTVELYERLPESTQNQILANIGQFHPRSAKQAGVITRISDWQRFVSLRPGGKGNLRMC